MRHAASGSPSRESTCSPSGPRALWTPGISGMAAPSTARCRVTMVGDNRAVRVSTEGAPAVLDDRVELRVQPTSGRRVLSHVLRTLVIPQGYTLSIAGSFALAVQ